LPFSGQYSGTEHHRTADNTYKSGLSHQLGLGPVWQPRYHLRLPQRPWEALAYIHANPVQAGIVVNAADYPWSSAGGRFDISPIECCI